MYKPFREQYKECKANGTVELLDTKETEEIFIRPNVQGHVSLKVNKVYFCNKYMKRCTSGVCANERGVKTLISKGI